MFNSPSGIIESPNWPNHYRGKALCTWTVSVDPSEVVTLRFNNFSLEQDRRCDKARLVVRDGSKDDNRELGFYCGMDSPIALTSSGNHLWLQFTSNEWADGKGFRVEYYTRKFVSEQLNISVSSIVDQTIYNISQSPIPSLEILVCDEFFFENLLIRTFRW